MSEDTIEAKKPRSRWHRPKQFAFVGFTAAAILGSILHSAVNAEVTAVAAHPQMVLETTAEAKTIKSLFPYNGRLYAGYGDYNNNTGPTAINYFDGVKFLAEPELLADTEQVSLFRTINGKVYVPSIDPKVSADFIVGTPTANGSLVWENRDVVSAIHVYDFATLNGSDIYMIGAMGHDAVVWRSLDHGATFELLYSVAPQVATDYARFYGAVVQNGKLYVQAYDLYNSPMLHRTSKVFDGRTWNDGPNLGLFSHSKTFAGQSLRYHTFHTGSYARAISAFDGVNDARLAGYFYDYAIDNDTLYGLNTNFDVVATKDLKTWTTVGSVPSVARSIGVLDGVLYVGGADSAIYRVGSSTVPAPTTTALAVTTTTAPITTVPPATGGKDTTPPVVTITNPTEGTVLKGGKINVTAKATDDYAVFRTEIYIDGKYVASGTTSAKYGWNVRSLASGPHRIEVKAFDAEGNEGVSVVNVTK